MEEDTQVCNKCLRRKPLDEFTKRSDTGKYRGECNLCKSEYLKKYRAENKDKIRELNERYRIKHKPELDKYRLEWQRNNKDKVRRYQQAYRNNLSEEQKELARARSKRYRDARSEDEEYKNRRRQWSKESARCRRADITRYERERKQNDPVFKLKKQVRGAIRAAFQRRGSRKSIHTEEILGCSLEFLSGYLKETFYKRYGREWDGVEKVDIDHIIPLSRAKTEAEIISLCHYTNLQLLTPEDNSRKSDKEDVA